jgi:heme A synthase
MSSARAFAVTSRLALATALLMFGLIVIGSVVRTTGSGLSCPDWPLCQGRLIPPFQFNVLIEWFHRLVALLVSLLLFATAASIFARREVRSVLGGLAALSLVLLFAQVLLGAFTVWKLLHPAVVASHLGVALLLFCTLLSIALAARSRSLPDLEVPARTPGLLPLFTLATAMTYAQALLGGVVSTNGAGLACPDWPACNGEMFPSLTGLVGIQVLHRWGAYALTAVMMLVAFRSRTAADPVVRTAGPIVLGFVLAQVAFGVLNILLGIPVWLSALHLGNAAAILGLMLILTLRLAFAPVAIAGALPAGAR